MLGRCAVYLLFDVLMSRSVRAMEQGGPQLRCCLCRDRVYSGGGLRHRAGVSGYYSMAEL